ncbi:sulfatase [Lacunimicrobium album]
MKRNWRFLLTCLAIVGLMLVGRAPAAERPNIVFILADDLGATDLGCYGSSFYETPRIDELCQSGMKFTRAYAACPVCSPTRASILTGKYPARVGITDWIPGNKSDGRLLETPEDLHDLPLEEVTLAETLAANGYENYLVGKWHLGKKISRPETQGFTNFFTPGEAKKEDQDKPDNQKSFLSPALADASVEFINKQTDEKPFFLYLCFHDPHTPIVEYKDTIEHFKAKAKSLPTNETESQPEHQGKTRLVQNNPAYASMVKAMDTAVGRVLDALKTKGFESTTIVLFTSDNGGLSTLKNPGPTSNAPLRAGKGWLYEGGIRVPLIVRAPGFTKEATTCDTPVISMDYYPTLLELGSLPSKPEQHVDGVSFTTLLKNEGHQQENAQARGLYWHYPHYHGSTWTPGAAVILGRHKLIVFYDPSGPGIKADEDTPFSEHHVKYELYNLVRDPFENHPANNDPVVAWTWFEDLTNWQKNVGAKLPTIRPAPKP